MRQMHEILHLKKLKIYICLYFALLYMSTCPDIMLLLKSWRSENHTPPIIIGLTKVNRHTSQ